MVCPRCKFYKLKGNYLTRGVCEGDLMEARICRLCDKDEQVMQDYSLEIPGPKDWPINWKPPERYEVIDKIGGM